MYAKFTISLRVFIACIILASSADAQTQVLEYEVQLSAGKLYLYTDSYGSGAGNCRNSLEYLPNGFNINDAEKKYPLILFFPGLGEQWNPADAGGQKPANDLSNYTPGISTSPSIVKVLRHPLPNSILNNTVNLNYTVGGTNYEFMVLALQCNEIKPLATVEDYENFIQGYFFEKYREKIDFSRVYITGISLGGGKAMEYMATGKRTLNSAAVVSVAMGSECPYTPTYTVDPVYDPTLAQANCADTSEYHNIITNLVMNRQIGVAYFHYKGDENQPVSIPQKFVADLNTRSINGNRALGIFPDGGSHGLSFPEAYDANSTSYDGQNMYRWFLNFSNSSAILLPIKVSSFTASLVNNTRVLLKWTTASESNASHFELERSANGKDFATVEKIAAAGNSSTARNYSFTDENPGAAVVYYRLKSTDRDGQFIYSEVKKVSFTNRGLSFSASPNPFRSDVSFTVEGNTRSVLSVTILDQAGRTMKQFSITKQAGKLTQKLDVTGLPAGLYLLSVRGDNINYTQRLIKQ